MSSIVKGGGEFDANAYLELAASLNIPLDDGHGELLEGESNSYTAFPVPEGVRKVVDAYKKDTIEWNIPGQTSEFKEKFYRVIAGEQVEYGAPLEIGGIIVGYTQRDHLAHYDGENLNVECSVIGYKHPQDGLIKELPPIPYKNKYAWVDKKLDRMTPDPMVERLGLVGSRKMTCEECIRCGMSFKDVEVKNGDKIETKTIECEPRGQLLIAVSELTKINIKKSPVKGQEPIEERSSMSIYDLVDEDGNPFTKPLLVCLPMSKSFIRGAFKSGIVGYADYIRNLEKNHKNSPQKNVIFNFTTIRMRKAEGGVIFQPHFQSYGVPSTDDIKAAVNSYQKPVRSAMPLALPSVSVVANYENSDNGYSGNNDYEDSPF
jgi:hypothetical protein